VKVVKVRGFSLNSTTSNRLNFNTLKKQVRQFIRSGTKDSIDVVQQRIERTHERMIVTKTSRKVYSLVYDKRVVMSGGNTLPFGY
jgi:hypothetical protein